MMVIFKILWDCTKKRGFQQKHLSTLLLNFSIVLSLIFLTVDSLGCGWFKTFS